MKYKTKSMHLFNIGNHVFFILLSLIIILPLLIVFLSSFKTNMEMAMYGPLAMPVSFFNLANFKEFLSEGNAIAGFTNSLILVFGAVVINTILSSMVAYSLSRFEFKLKKFYFLLFALGMMIPGFVTEIARFGIVIKLGLYDSLLAPLLIYAGTDIIQLYIYKQFIDRIPMSLDESARIDGCSYFGIYWKIIFPIIIPATATLAILKAIAVFNDMYIPYLYMPTKKTITTMLMQYVGRSGDWSRLSAAVIITMIPSFLIYTFFKKYIFDGIVAGAVKE